MNIFGDFYSRAYSFRSSKKEKKVRQSEDWAAAILSGSSENIQLEEPLKTPMYLLFVFVFVLVVMVLVGRLAYLQIVTGQKNSLLASGNRIRTTVTAAPRGVIYDRNGTILVRNNARFDLVVVPAQLPKDSQQRQRVFEIISTIMQKPYEEIEKKTYEKGKDYPAPVVLVENIPREQSLQLDEKHNELLGVSVETNPSREYLDGGNLAHFLGYIGRISKEEYEQNPEYRPIDVIGKTGLEKSYESQLRGEYGKEQTEVNAQGLPQRALAQVEPKAGNDVVLSIDKPLQDMMSTTLANAVNSAGSKAGTVVAVDPRNGQVLGAVNYPSYDANLFAKGISQNEYQSLLNNTSKPLFNRVASGSYPIGSTIKPFISLAGLEEGIVKSTSTTIVDKGKLDVVNQYNPSIVYTFKGWKPEGLGSVNILRAIAWSSDIFYYMVGGGFESFRGLGPTKLTDWYKKFGFGSSTAADIGDQSNGFVPTPDTKRLVSQDPWFVGDTYNISIGQGDMRATPLQLAMATAAIANGGTLYKPKFASSIKNSSGQVIDTIEPEVVQSQLGKPENIALIKKGMEGTVEYGTACCSLKSQVPVVVAGKTGTAETSSEGFDGKNLRTKAHAWFTAYAPADNPKIVLVVLVENAGEGSQFALPVATDILKYYFSTPRN